jgi:hypothetical protein
MALKKLQVASSAIVDAEKMISLRPEGMTGTRIAIAEAKKNVADAIVRINGGPEALSGVELLSSIR